MPTYKTDTTQKIVHDQNINEFQHIIPRSLGSIVRGYKIGVTKWCRQNEDGYFTWQRNYYEHIVRNDLELYFIREYIKNNPKKWERDRNNDRDNRRVTEFCDPTITD